MTRRLPFLLAALALALGGLAMAAARAPEMPARTAVIERDDDDAEIFVRLHGPEFVALMDRSAAGRALLAEVLVEGRLDSGRVQDLKVDLAEAALGAIAVEVAGRPHAAEPMGLLAHDAALARPMADPLGAWDAIGICLVPGEAPMIPVAEAVVDVGLIAWPLPATGELRVTFDLPGGPPASVHGWDAMAPRPARLEGAVAVLP